MAKRMSREQGEILVMKALVERAANYIHDAVCEEDVSNRAEGLLLLSLDLIREAIGTDDEE